MVIRMAKNIGKEFEERVKQSFEKISDVSIDRLRDAPKKLKNVDNPSDFIVYKEPYEIYVECKSHRKNTLPFSCIKDSQLEGMKEKSKIKGVKCGLLIWYIDHDITVWIPIQDVLRWKELGAKSINVKDLDYLDCIYVKGTKKRVYFDYDMNEFLEVLYEQV